MDLPMTIQGLLHLAEETGWNKPLYLDDLLADILEDFEEGFTLGYWELLGAYLITNKDLGWYERHNVATQHRILYVNGIARYWHWPNIFPEGRKKARIDQHGIFHVEVRP